MGTEVEEDVLELGPGVTEIDADNTKTEKSVQKTEETLEDGSTVKKTVTVTRAELVSAPVAEVAAASQAVTLEQVPIEMVAEDESSMTPAALLEKAPEVLQKEPEVTTQLVEGDVECKTEVEEKEETKEDGTLVQRRVTTKKQVQSVTEIVLTDGVESDRHTSEKHMGTEVEEDVLELGPGVTDIDADNTKTEKSVQKTEETLEDGSTVKKTVTVTRVELVSAPVAEVAAASQAVTLEQVPSEMVTEDESSMTPAALLEKAPEVLQKEPEVTTQLVEGDVECKTEVDEKEETKEDGT
jgi:hypothetical protein